MKTQVELAREFAIKMHGYQMYGQSPYVQHLDEVHNVLANYNETHRTGSFLHDLVEDTKVTKADIATRFGVFMSDLIDILSDEEGVNRKERKAKTYAKMKLVKGDLIIALGIKLADRIANIENGLKHKNFKLLKMYFKEREAFKDAVYREGHYQELWARLENAFDHYQVLLINK